MADSNHGKIAVVTGINGYIASVLGRQLLEAGYTVRGTARNVDSLSTLQNGAYKQFGDRFQPCELKDLTIDQCFDEAVKGAHLIFHTASPVVFDELPWPFYRDPAVKGTTNVLKAAQRTAGPQLSAVVITSSIAATRDDTKPQGYTLTEKDWLHKGLEDLEALGDSAPPGRYYAVSKAAAERAVWQWVDDHKPSFAVSTILPGVVIGPPVQPPTDPAKLNATLIPVYDVFSGKAKDMPATVGTGGFVDVRDIVHMHIWAAENPARSNRERFLGVAGYAPYQAQSDVMQKAYPTRAQITKGTPGEGYLPDYSYPEDVPLRASGEKAVRVMGFEYIGLEKAVLDTVALFERLYG